MMAVYNGTDGQYQGEQGQQVDAESGDVQRGKRTDKRYEDTDGRDEGGTRILQKHVYHEYDQHDGFQQGFDDFIDRSVEEIFGTHQFHDFHVFRQGFFQFIQVLVYFCNDFVGIGSGGLVNHTGSSRCTVHRSGIGIALGTQFHGGDVFQFQYASVIVGPDDDFFELLFLFQTSAVFQGILVHIFRIFTDGAGRSFYILAGKGGFYIARLQFVLGHYVRFQPDTHGIVTSHDIYFAYSRYTLYLWLDVDAQVVGQEVPVVGTVRTVKPENFQHTALAFHGGDTYFGHFGRQKRSGCRNLVLYVYSRHVRVTSLFEIDRNFGATRVAGGRSHVSHVLYSVDGFFQWHDDTFLNRFGIGAAIGRGNSDGRRCDVRILFYR